MRKLTNKKQIFLYGIAGLGVNMLNLIIGSYLCDALMTEGFSANVEHWTYLNKTLVVAAVWSVLNAVAKVLDGVIDIPFASFTDNLKSRFGKRRPAIVLGFVPMVLAYVGFLFPLTDGQSLLNTIWFGVMLCAFYAFYTLTMVTYYATFSEIVDEENRLFLSNVKTVFDVVYFVLGYALIPLLIDSLNIRTIAFLFLPLSLTMVIPLILIKEKSTLDKDREEQPAEEKEEHVGLWKSLVYSLKNKGFLRWLAVFFALQFSLQLFLTGQNVLYSGAMQLSGGQISIIMACAFAPVPFTLLLYNKITKKRGVRAGYLFSLFFFILAMAVMTLCRADIVPNVTARVILACVGAVLASFGIGCFFSVNYVVPSTVAALEKQKTGVSNPAMYFAVQGLVGGIASALSTGVVWINLKALEGGAYVWTAPLIIAFGCLVSFALTFALPKEVCEIGMLKEKG